MAKINFPSSPSLNQTFSHSSSAGVQQWKWNGYAWQKSAATETGNAEGNTGEVAFYPGLGSDIRGATAFFYGGAGVGIGTSGPTELLDVRGGITASNIYIAGGATFGSDVNVVGGITADTLQVVSGATFGGRVIVDDELHVGGHLHFPDGSTQGVAGIEFFSRQEDGNPLKNGNPTDAIYKGLDISSADADDITVAQQSADTSGIPQKTVKYLLSIGSNIPKKDETNTFSHSQGNTFITEIGASKYAPGNATQVFLASLDHSTSTYIGVTGGVINYKILGSEVAKATSDRVEFAHGISAAGATLCNTSSEIIHCYDGELNRPKLKDYSETVKAHGTKSSDFDLSFADGNVHTFQVGGALTVSVTNPPASGIAGAMTLIITHGGSSTLTWDPQIDWPSGVAPSLSSSGVDVISLLTTDGGGTIYGFVGGLNFS